MGHPYRVIARAVLTLLLISSHFVPNITMGAPIVGALSKHNKVFMGRHLWLFKELIC